MVINMNETQLRTIEQIEAFLAGSEPVEFTAAGDDSARYAFISRTPSRFDHPRRGKRDRGVLRRYLEHVSGYSRARVSRLISRWHTNRLADTPWHKQYQVPAAPFARKYTAEDIALLVEMDRAHEDVCGPAIAHLLRRAWHVFGDARYERLPSVSGMRLSPLRRASSEITFQKMHSSLRQGFSPWLKPGNWRANLDEKPPTGGPCAGEPHARFGGRGG